MPLFFILSGFLFSPKPIKTYFQKSALRLLLPYCMFLLVISLPEFAVYLRHHDMGGGKTLLFNMIYGGGNLKGNYAVFWFITVLWMSTNLFNLLISLNVKIWLLPILIFIGYSIQYTSSQLPWNIQVVPMAVSYIWVGNILKIQITDTWNFSTRKKYPLIAIIAVAILIIIFLLRHELTLDMKYSDYGLPFISFASSILATISIAVFCVLISTSSIIGKTLCMIGEASMVIMYLHMPIKFIIMSKLNLIEYNIVNILGGILLSFAVYYLLKQTRISRKLFLGESK